MLKHLKQLYGFNSFRESQKEIIENVINGIDQIAIFPTGAGKSLLYQFPATFLNKITIVICPLISLMGDQSNHLSNKGINSLCLNSSYKKPKTSLLRKKSNIPFSSGIIYTTPEYLLSNINFLYSIKDHICLFAIDEAHCISKWGNDFRPTYSKLNIIKNNFTDIPIIALTASATPNVVDDIFDVLELNEVDEFVSSTYRPNLSINVKKMSGDILSDLSIIPGNECTIVYVNTRKKAEEISELLNRNKYKSVSYHAGMTLENRKKAYEQFMNGNIKIIVATICFGMGIDKSNIRSVINYGMPSNIESYYQEFGRAGRDGLESTVTLYYCDRDYMTHQFLISKTTDEQKKVKMNLLNIFSKYVQNYDICRQFLIETYFKSGDIKSKIGDDKHNRCNKCDNCKRKDIKKTDIYEDAKVVINVVKSLNINLGITKLINIIKGTDRKFNRNPFFGNGYNHSVLYWKQIINRMVNDDLLQKVPYGTYGNTLKLGEQILSNPYLVYIPNTKSSKNKIPIYYTKIRKKLSIQSKIPEHIIINDKILLEISKRKPTTLEELFHIDGITNEFISKYGQYFIKNIENKTNTEHITWNMFKTGLSIDEIAIRRLLTRITIENHLIKGFEKQPSEISRNLLPVNVENTVINAISFVGKNRLKPIKQYIDSGDIKVSYFQIRLTIIKNSKSKYFNIK